MARFLHTADLHLGKVIYNERLLDDQAAMLKEILEIIDAQKPDALLIAGDVFDRSVPPSDAVELLDDFLHAVCKERNTAVVMIPGNHDSADRVGFGARLLGDRLHIVSSLDRCTTPLTLHDTHGPIDVYGLPFLEPARVRAWTQDEDIRDHHTATAAMTARILQQNGASRKVLLAHAFVTGGLTSDSERALTIGGLDTVESSVFDGFSYVALGHLHRPQHVGREAVQYSGSPLKYSASEVGYQKSITQIDLDAEGQCDIVRHPLHPVRDLVILEGLFDDIIGDASEAAETDLIIARVADKGPIYNAMSRLRTRWPNALHIERTHRHDGPVTPLSGIDHREQTTSELFHTFFQSVTGDELSAAEVHELNAVLGSLEGGSNA